MVGRVKIDRDIRGSDEEEPCIVYGMPVFWDDYA